VHYLPWERSRGQNGSQYIGIIDSPVEKEAIGEVKDLKSQEFLQLLVPGPKTKWNKEIDHKPEASELLCCESHVCDGNTSGGAQGLENRPLDNFHRSEGCFHIPIKRSSRKYLRFLALNRVWQYKVLCFGLKTAHCLVTRTIQPLAVWVSSQGIQVHVYIDCWLVVAKDRQTWLVRTRKGLKKSLELGWFINTEKSCLNPTQKFTFLGMACNTEQNFEQPTAKRIAGIATAVQNIITEQRTSPWLLLSLIGRMISVGQLLPFPKLERRPLQYLS
jgi:hypothetical protein